VVQEVKKVHFKVLRVVILDYKQRTSRVIISRKTQRLPPNLWMRFTAASTIMKIWFTCSPERLKTMAFINTFTKSSKEGLLFGFDDSMHKVGRQTSKN